MEKDIEKDTEDFESAPTFTLIDEESGKEEEYVLLARTVYRDKLYYALAALLDPESYVILGVSEDGDDIVFETVTDDILFDELAALFDELLSEELDYDSE